MYPEEICARLCEIADATERRARRLIDSHPSGTAERIGGLALKDDAGFLRSLATQIEATGDADPVAKTMIGELAGGVYDR